MKLLTAVPLLFLLAQLPPIPGCPDDKAEPYDCDNPPQLAGLVEVENPIPGEFNIVLKVAELGPRTLGGRAAAMSVEPLQSRIPALASARSFSNVGVLAAEVNESTLQTVLADPAVAYVVQNGVKTTQTSVWGLDRIDQRKLPLSGSYDPVGDGAGVKVGVIDTGIWPHEDFAGRVADECFTAHVFGGCTDQHGHGTHVAGTVAGRIFGAASKATLYSIRVLDDRGSGSDSDVIAGIDWAIENDLDVINMSLGGSASPALDAAVCRAWKAGIVSISAAGNDTTDARKSSPARVVQQLTVCATDKTDMFAGFSNRGPVVDICAPGVDILSANRGGGSSTKSGTSMAAPHVAGVAALYLSDHPDAGPDAVMAAIVANATEGEIRNHPADTPNAIPYVGRPPS